MPMTSQKKVQPLSKVERKIRKLRRNPKLFLADSKAYIHTRKTLYQTWAKLGSFALVIAASLLIVVYFSLIASPRYVSQAQFVVKQADQSHIPLMGLAAITGSSPTMRDALILQEYIRSPEMALALNTQVNLKQHYQADTWDIISRLSKDSSQEEYIAYFKQHIHVNYDEMSEILTIEVQAFTPEFALATTQALLKVSEQFINQLGESMAKQQLEYAKKEVNRAYDELKLQQVKLIAFQDEFSLFNPELQSASLLEAMNQLESQIIAKQAELKSLNAYMRSDASEIIAKQFQIEALTSQLAQEKQKLTQEDKPSLNKVSLRFKDIELNTTLAADLYQSSLITLEQMRSDAFKQLKHLLIIEYPRIAQDNQYPKRLYNIMTWFVVLLLLYLVGRLIIAIIKEHRE